jgi:glycosyltransferase involved in cell wall biosynthesis
MKVLQINQVVTVTSTGRIVENFGNFLMSKGHESYIAYSGRPKSTSKSKLYQISNTLDTNLHALGTRLFDTHGLHSKLVTKKFIAWIKQIKPDVIHLHNIHGYYLNYPIFFDFLSSYNKPVFWTFHDFWPITGHCSYFSDVDCNKWITGCFSCPKLNYYPSSYYYDNSKKNYQIKNEYFNKIKNLHLITISNWSESLVKESFLKNFKISTISNAIDSKTFNILNSEEQFLREKHKFESKKILIALATTWGKRNGYYDYIELSKKIDDDYQIVLVGLSGKLAQNLPPNITAVPRTNSFEELVSLYNISEISMNLSYQETFGLTTVEGMMCGLPAVVYNATASPELVNEEVGIVVEPGDIDGVVNAILNIQNNGGKESYSNKCRNYATEKFDATIVHEKILDLYQSVI